MNMLRKWMTVCFCIFGLWTGAAQARDITFDLRDANGPVTQKSYPGKYLLLAIGYTSCPDICPTTLYEYGLVMKALKNPDAIQPIFVTIDPVNDDVERLNTYTRFFDERIVGLTGEMKNIQALADQLGATFGYRMDGKKVDNPKPGMSYTVYHSALIYLIDPDRKLMDVFDYQIGAKGLTEALDKVLGDGKGGPAPKAAAPESNKQDTPQTAAPAAANGKAACALPAGFEAAKQAVALKDVMADAPADKVVLLNLWALWCAPCRTELPLLDKLAASQKAMKVQTLNLGDKEPDIATLFAKMGLKNLPQTSTQGSDVLQRLGAPGLPFTGLFVNGKMAAAKSGVIDKTDALAEYAKCAAASK